MNDQLKRRDPHRFFNPARFLVGLLIVAYGLSAFGKVTGIFDLHFDVLKVWPLFVVAAGLSIIPDSKRVFQILKWSIFFISVAAAVYLIATDTTNSFGLKKSAFTEEVKLLPDVEKVEVYATLGPGNIRFYGNEQKNTLTVITNKSGYFEKPISELKQRVQSIRIARKENIDLSVRPVDVEILLPKSVATGLNIKTGASNIRIDLRDVKTECINLESGASNAEIILSKISKVQILNISGGASNIVLTVPEDAFVEIYSGSGLTSFSLPADFKKQDDGSIKKGTGKEPARIKININTGASIVKFKIYR